MEDMKAKITEIESFGDWLKRVRVKKGFTQESLAKAAKDVCTSAYISSLERKQDVSKKGRPTRPSTEIVDALAIAMDIPVEVAREKAGYSGPKKPSTQDSVNNGPYAETIEEALEIAQFFDAKKGLSESDKDFIRQHLRMLDREIERMEREKKSAVV